MCQATTQPDSQTARQPGCICSCFGLLACLLDAHKCLLVFLSAGKRERKQFSRGAASRDLCVFLLCLTAVCGPLRQAGICFSQASSDLPPPPPPPPSSKLFSVSTALLYPLLVIYTLHDSQIHLSTSPRLSSSSFLQVYTYISAACSPLPCQWPIDDCLCCFTSCYLVYFPSYFS
ncbi:hypothetical protein BKA80DRAFT_141502 [Phyllosticta citrichinensis]